MRITCSKNDGRADYFPVFLGNGSLSVLMDYEGAQNPRPPMKNVPDPCLLKAGVRYGDCFRRDLVPLGVLRQTVSVPGGRPSAVADWSQSFDPERAVTECRAVYENGVTVVTTAFVPFGADKIVMRKRITAPSAFVFDFSYVLTDRAGGGRPRRVKFTDPPPRGLAFEIDGIRPFDFVVTLDASAGVCIREENRLTLNLCGEREAVADVVLSLTEEGESPAVGTFDEILAAHEKDCLAYAREGYVRTGDAALDEAFAVAAYHLRASMTRWSIPTGIFRTHWDAKFFGFDEYFCLAGLLAANHLSAARHVPDFRFAMLPTAIRRAVSERNEHKEAHYCWETIENFEEASPPGFWHEHIFHMANIPLGAYKYARFAGDDTYLREKALPMLRACCYHFTDHYVFREFAPETERGYRCVIGPVTDLERLGASRRNAYMTTCAVIATLRAFADTVRRLGAEDDAAYAAECESIAAELERDLPTEDGRFVPYPGCPQKSIAVVTGTFPYEVIAHDDPRQTAALADYEAHELEYGNMYAVGSGVGAWYALWKAMLYARLSDGEGAFRAIRQAVGTTGAFREMWEINEAPKTVFRPWFTTSSGILLSALGEAFCRREGDVLYLCSAVPETLKTFSFRLAAIGGIVAECEVRDDRVVRLELTGSTAGVTVVLPERFRR